MQKSLRVLIVQDAEDDVRLLVRKLRRRGYEPTYEQILTAEGLTAAIKRHAWDLVITGHNLPHISYSEVLALLKEAGIDVPVIIVSHAVEEELIVAAMRAGAHDYVAKDDLARLLPAIERELRAAEARRARLHAEDAVRHMVHHDPLTGLVNRREFERRLGRVLDTARAEHTEHVLCYLDLDQFKTVNEVCGHVAGDELLRQLGGVLQAQVRKRDTLGRLGGDEFGILMEHCSLPQAVRVANAVRAAIGEFRFIWGDKRFNVQVSFGLVPVTRTGESVGAMLRAADAACYMAKAAGRNRIHVHREGDLESSRRQGEMRWVFQINRALEEDRFRLSFQPIAPVKARIREGPHYELFLWMEDEEGHTVLPGAFLPAAERYNLAARLDRWVVRAAFEWLGRHPAHLEQMFLCANNLSGQSLGDEEFLAFVIREFEETAVPAEKICFEITEAAAMANLAETTQFIRVLKERGCRFALDHFGSALSSLSCLRNLPVDFLKIDGIIVRHIVEDPLDLAIVRAINDIGQAMGKQTIAEFVENDGILQKLRDIGVDYAQGYGISRPRPIEEMC